jgi:hypothetical protein
MSRVLLGATVPSLHDVEALANAASALSPVEFLVESSSW